MYLTPEVREDLLFWQTHIPFLKGQPIWFEPGVTRVAYSDVSSTGYRGYVVELGPEVAHGQWSEVEASQSSTWRELKAVHQVLCSYTPQLKGHTLKWFTDNQNVVRIVQVGSAKPHLQDGPMTVFETCFQYGISLQMEWIPHSLNDKADYISRIIDFDDWQLSPQIFWQLDGVWGPHTID